MKKVVLVAFLLFLLTLLAGVGICGIEDIKLENEDGHMWNQLSEETKSGFVRGYFISSMYLTKNAKRSIENIKKTTKDKIIIGRLEGFEKFTLGVFIPSNVSVGQVKDGLDDFYKDYRNRQIPICEAIYIVRFSALGGSIEEREECLELLRIPPESRGKDFLTKWIIIRIQRAGFFMPTPIHTVDVDKKIK